MKYYRQQHFVIMQLKPAQFFAYLDEIQYIEDPNKKRVPPETMVADSITDVQKFFMGG